MFGDMANVLPIKRLLKSVVQPREGGERDPWQPSVLFPKLNIKVLVGCWCWTMLWNSEGGERESRVLLESASWLQNETRKTNTGLKLDFPKHCIPSHFTHHCGLQTRIESPVKSASDSERRTRWNIRKTNVLRWDLMRSEGRNLFICGMLWNCPAYVDFPSLETEFQLLKTFFRPYSSTLHVKSTSLPSVLPWAPTHSSNCPALAAAADTLIPNEGDAGNKGYLRRQWHSSRCGPPPENLRL